MVHKHSPTPEQVQELLKDEEVRISLTHCGDWDYFLSQLTNELSRKCPFCQVDEKKNKSLDGSNKYWRVQRSKFPKKHSEIHLLIVPRRHITHIKELTIREWVALLRAGWWVLKNFDLAGGGIIWRFGSLKYTAASVRHSHVNIIVPNLQGEIRDPLAKTPAKVRENDTRLEFFLSHVLAGTAPDETWKKHMERLKLSFEKKD